MGLEVGTSLVPPQREGLKAEISRQDLVRCVCTVKPQSQPWGWGHRALALALPAGRAPPQPSAALPQVCITSVASQVS